MKLLKLRFENLNSLAGKTEIDFEQGPLASSGLFVISGPTGAGKSTILDALSLALFHQTPRLGRINAAAADGHSPLMTRGRATMHAEVEFIVEGSRYLARWEQSTARQKPGERLQPPKARLERDGKILTEKLKDKEEHLEALLGLDFDRFTRSVLLAQGGFTAFLFAEKGRADLLAKLTGTQIYEQLSKKAYEQYGRLKTESELLKARLNSLSVLSEDERLDLLAQQHTLTALLDSARSQSQQLEGFLGAYARRREDEAQHAQRLAEQSQLQAQAEAIAQMQARLARHQSALGGQPLHEALLQAQASVKGQRSALASAQHTHHQRHQAYVQYTLACGQKALGQYQTSTTRLSALEAELARLKAQQAPDQGRFQTLEAQLPHWQASLKALGQTQHEHSQLQNQLSQLQAQLSALQAELAPKEAALAQQGELVQQAHALWVAAQAQAQAQPQDSQTLQVLSQRFEGLKQLYSQLEGYQRKQGELSQRHQHDLARESQLEAAKTRYAEGQTKLAEQEHLLLLLREAVQLAQQVQSLKEQREALKDGEACPLCGSHEHPYRQSGVEALVSDRKKELKDQEAAFKKAQKALEAEGAQLSALQATHTLELSHTHTLDAELQAQHASLQQAALSLGQEVGVLDSLAALAQVRQQAQETFEAAHAQQLKAEALAQAATQAGQHYQRQQEVLARLQEELAAQQQHQRSLQDEAQLLSQRQHHLQAQLQAGQTELLTHLALSQWPLAAGLTLEAHVQALAQTLSQWKADTQALSQVQRDLEAQTRTVQQSQEQLTLWQERCEHLSPQVWATLQPLPGLIEEKLWLVQHQQAQEALVAYRSLEATVTQLQAHLDEATQQWERWLSQHQWESAQAWALAVLPKDEALALEQHLDTYHEHTTRLRLALEELAQRLSQPLPDTRPEAELKALAEAARLAIEQHSEALGALKNRLSIDAANRSSLAQEQASLERLQTELHWASRLNELMGSANGEKFSRFAQSLTLRHLTFMANAHLSLLQPRYRLDVAKQGELELDIVDLAQGEARRPVKTLSGGESFLVSLALALALGELMAQRIQVQSLFLDEGFGTLSPDALEDALQVLDRLQATGRCVGIITHVDAVKQRIPTIIEVKPRSGGLSQVVLP